MNFYRVSVPKHDDAPQVVAIELTEEKAHGTGRDLFGQPPYMVEVVDIEPCARSVQRLLLGSPRIEWRQIHPKPTGPRPAF